jgi:hypothetical protein
MTSVDVEMAKCACPDCVCVVPLAKAVMRGGKTYCCDECATGHPDQRLRPRRLHLRGLILLPLGGLANG